MLLLTPFSTHLSFRWTLPLKKGTRRIQENGERKVKWETS
jgi:hypothetical protein